ncbi:TetR/AcrR family transcriptional regulator [Amycolatopsis thermoflava]|uniref:TetR/AcrR family transcriptional regulator n=1 Tax=Amycolatopsis thermoflava TaxID=84480 RepID=UPI0038126ECC
MSSAARPYRGISAEDRKAQRRRKLIDAALDLMGTVGTDQATMTAICVRAGLTERYFYENFTRRDELLIAVVDRMADEVRETVLSTLRATEGDAAERARVAIEAFVRLLTDDPRKGRAAILESSALPALRSRRHELLRMFAGLVVTQARALFGDDAVPAPRDELNALMLVGGLAELLATWLGGEMDTPVEDIIDVATRWFVTGMRA